MSNFEQQAEQLFESKGDLTDVDTMSLLMGQGDGEGETSTTASTEGADAATGAANGGETTSTPSAGTTDETTGKEGTGTAQENGAEGAAPGAAKTEGAAAPDATTEDPSKTVILAKDGVHTIPYDKLTEARETAKAAAARATAAEAEAERLRAELAAAKAAPAPAPAAAPAADGEPQPLFGDYSEEALKGGVEKIVEERVKAVLDQRLAPVESKAIEDSMTAHLTTIYTAHPDADSIMESAEFEGWMKAQPSVVQRAYRATLAPKTGGTADEVVEVFDAYRAAHPAKAPAPAAAPAAPAPSVAERAQAVIANTKPKELTSLTDIPAGATAHVSPVEALTNMDEVSALNQMMGMDPSKIEELLMKAV